MDTAIAARAIHMASKLGTARGHADLIYHAAKYALIRLDRDEPAVADAIECLRKIIEHAEIVRER